MLQHLSLDAANWLAAAGMPEDYILQGQAYNDADVLLEAAQHGQGIALGRLSVAWRRLQAGSLVLASDVVCATPRDNLLVLREDSATLPEVRAFSDWLREQARLWRVQMEVFDKQGMGSH
jgi:LysR family glycine cleavage system transcriptional activator